MFVIWISLVFVCSFANRKTNHYDTVFAQLPKACLSSWVVIPIYRYTLLRSFTNPTSPTRQKPTGTTKSQSSTISSVRYYWSWDALAFIIPSKKMILEETHPVFRSNVKARWLFIGLGAAHFFYLLSNFILLLVAHPELQISQLNVNIWIIVLVWLAFAGFLNCAHFLVWEQERVDKIWDLWVDWAMKHPHTEKKWRRMINYRNMYLCVASVITVVPPIAVGAGMATAKAGSLIEGLLIPILHGTLEVNHIILTINFTCISLLIYGTAAFATVFFVTNCLLITEELKFLYHTTAKSLEDSHIWDTVKVV